MKTALTPLLLCLLLATGGCRQREPQTGVARNGAFAKAKNHTGPNLQRIIDSKYNNEPAVNIGIAYQGFFL